MLSLKIPNLEHPESKPTRQGTLGAPSTCPQEIGIISHKKGLQNCQQRPLTVPVQLFGLSNTTAYPILIIQALIQKHS